MARARDDNHVFAGKGVAQSAWEIFTLIVTIGLVGETQSVCELARPTDDDNVVRIRQRWPTVERIFRIWVDHDKF